MKRYIVRGGGLNKDIKTTPRLNHGAYSLKYYREIAKLVEDMTRSFEYWTLATLRKTDVVTQDEANPANVLKNTLKELISKWGKKVALLAPILASKQLKRLLAYVNGQYRPLLGGSADKETERLKAIIKARYLENMALIKSVPQDLLKRYEAVLYDAVTGGDEASVLKRLKTIKGITLRQAKLIASDQTSKAIESINIARQEQLGLEYYIWLTAGDERVSTGFGGHSKLDGLIFRYDKPEAVIDSYGHRGRPAERPRCRCTSLGVFLEQGERIEKAKVGYKIVRVA